MFGECTECGADVHRVFEFSRLHYDSQCWVTEKFCSGGCREQWLTRHPYLVPRSHVRVERGCLKTNH